MALIALAAVVSVAPLHRANDDDRRAVLVRPQDTGEVLDNPGMGWVLHFYDNVPSNYGSRLAYSDTVDDFPGIGVVYLRIPWSYLEPEEGRLNWSVLDTPAQRWIRKGKQIAFRFSCSESWMRYATPQWVEEAGARGYNFRPGAGVQDNGPFWEPDYEDAVFLEKLDRFLAAAAQRYDGDPNVAWIDVGSFGVWGEGHTYASTQLPYSADTIIRHIDLHLKHFGRTLLAANDDFALQNRGMRAIDYAREKGLTLRDDSILVQGGDQAYKSAEMAQAFWPSVPVVLESEHYGGSKARGNWQDGSLFLEALEKYHASYPSIHWWPREFLAENRELVRRMGLRMGYRLQLVEATWTSHVTLGDELHFSSQWRNAGVAPCYPGGHPTVILKDEKAGIAAVFVDTSLDMRDLPIGPAGEAETRRHEASFRLPFNQRAGEYDLYVAVGDRVGLPKINLPLAGGDGEKRYLLGKLRITGAYGVEVGQLRQRDGDFLLPVTWTIHRALPAGAVPFCHFERDGQIAFHGQPDAGDPAGVIARGGVVELGLVFRPPADARGKAFLVKLGIWVPERIGHQDERMVPDRGEGDRRALVGELRVADDGHVEFLPST